MENSKSDFANTLADTVFKGMNDCERYGMTWGCDTDCPVLIKGECELKDNENKQLHKKAQTEQLILHSVGINEERVTFCTECNGEGGFQFSADPDDCKLCDKCKGKGVI